MGVREWSIKPGELKALDRPQLLLFGLRLALRVRPWLAPGAAPAWDDAIRFVLDQAAGAAPDAQAGRGHYRALNEASVGKAARATLPDDVAAECAGYAYQVPGTVAEATAITNLARLRKDIILAARLSASIAAVLAHAGRVKVARGDPVDAAAGAAWDAIRADLKLPAETWTRAAATADPVSALRNLAPLWPGKVPAWVPK